MGWSWWLLAVCAVLAVPTALAPDGALAGPTYLAGLALVVFVLWWRAVHLARGQRRPWLLLALTASCWLAGDSTERVLERFANYHAEVGPPDVFWLASYPLLIAAVACMIGARGLPAALIRGIRMDVIVIGVAAGVGAWHLLIAPSVDGGVSVLTSVVTVLYPLGDVTIFAVAITLLMTPGRHGTASSLLIACLGLTLPLDVVQTLLQLASGWDGAQLDAALLVVNGLLGAAALHPSRVALTAPVSTYSSHAMHRWRIVLLGISLCTVSVVSAIPGQGALNLAPSLVASVIVSVTVVVRFYLVVLEREAAEAALSHLAHHDRLTGVANRAVLMKRLAAPVRREDDRAHTLVLVFIDLDRFKAVNDTWDHPAGDQVLRTVAQRLAVLVRPADTVARVGGDEFVVLCHGMSHEYAEAFGHRIQAAVSEPIDLGAAQVCIGASIGVLSDKTGTYTSETDSLLAADDLLRRADWVMYEAKRDGGGVRTTRPAKVIGTAVHGQLRAS